MDSIEVASQLDKKAFQILEMSIGTVLGEQSKIHQFVKLAVERPSSINVDRARRTFDALPVYQRRRVAETAEGNAHKQKSGSSMAAILSRLGNEQPKLRSKPVEKLLETKAVAKKLAREVVWK